MKIGCDSTAQAADLYVGDKGYAHSYVGLPVSSIERVDLGLPVHTYIPGMVHTYPVPEVHPSIFTTRYLVLICTRGTLFCVSCLLSFIDRI